MTKIPRITRQPRKIRLRHKEPKETKDKLQPKTAKKPARAEKFLANGWMNEIAAANYVGLSASRLQNRRSLHLPPRFEKVGGCRVFYKPEDLDEFNISQENKKRR